MGIFNGIDLEKLKILVSNGLSDKAIAEFYGVTPATFSAWKRKFPAFNEAFQNWKAIADAEVEHALHKMAVGYTETITTMIRDKKTKELIPIQEVRHFPASVTAAIKWLESRKPDEWGKNPVPVPVTEVNVQVGVNVSVQQPDLDERIKQITFGRDLEDALR